MEQQIQKVCQQKLGGKWKDGCCTDNPPVDHISFPSNAIASAEQYPIASTESQTDSPAANTVLIQD
ncbi:MULTISPECIES: hypothetical protein [Calothrix]|uniref:Uncharacterized protein n=2 Tax=Calothrix TaxID=1186 RepID=A0ABR8AB38_9CYAN|nr:MULTISPECIES: hypothetical protein [Calothrix]MBD2197225.1 hypothetical protein [Calothrix parietina FACHB-288]MBD2206796.1 hypothetical protein [Calothrix sp. FACHB-168]MBD2218614.1 hypothetical protein [Calothrix sp. FACHB-1219]MBD2225942.1 hypothetical protein [Calothrix anomala FACHB-343]